MASPTKGYASPPAVSESLLTKEKNDSQNSTDSEDVSSEMASDRHTWGKKAEYYLSVIGFCVGLGNVWRFPYVCMRNGGGAFLVPFFLALFICAFPVYFLEVALGQFSGKGPWHSWNLCPLFKGIGISMNILCIMVGWYYSMIMGWCLIYMVNSFKSPLPWTLCGQSWNTENCSAPHGFTIEDNSTAGTTAAAAAASVNVTATTLAAQFLPGIENSTDFLSNVSSAVVDGISISTTTRALLDNRTRVLSTEEFWQNNVLELSSGIDNLGGLPWHTAVSLVVSNVIVTIAVIKGISSSGKVVYVTATLPYILLGVIFIMGCTLPGAGDGILFYITPDFNKLLLIQTWVEACIQVFYSLGPGWGCLVTMASYNKFNNNCLRDSILLTIICEGTSVFGGFAIFTVLGHMAHVLQVPIMDFAKSGAGLAFIVYPEAISYLPVPQLWGFLFFLMLFTVGLDSLFANVETIMTTIADIWPAFMRRWRTLTTISCMVVLTSMGLIFTSRGGAYVFQLVDWYIAAFTLLIQAALQCIVVAWLYGSERFSYDIELMIGRRPPTFILIAWKFICPILLMIIFFITLVVYEPPAFAGYIYPQYALVIGWMLAILPFSSIVVYAIIILVKQEGTLIQRLKSSIMPPAEWGPSDPQAMEKYRYQAVDLHSVSHFSLPSEEGTKFTSLSCEKV